jgi:hypothetical protein
MGRYVMAVGAATQVEDRSKAKVFISYSRKDIEFADRLDAALKARGSEPLIDRTDIYAFEEWWKRVEPTTLYVDECPTDERQHHEKHDA